MFACTAGGATGVAAGSAALGVSRVWHRRNQPRHHEFTYNINQIWIDPDRPEELFDRHALWSDRRPSPIRFRQRDYFDGTGRSIGRGVRDTLAAALGREPTGPIRMLTQPRTWGWLFNPITVYLAWDDDGADPVGSVLEVTNTPWKERLAYPMTLDRVGDRLVALFDKRLHVSPFLDQDHTYRLSLGADGDPGNLDMAIDVLRPTAHLGPVGDEAPSVRTRAADPVAVVETRLRLQLVEPTATAMTTALYRNPLPTHRVSLGIHLQAARLLGKRVPFVPHPRRKS
ncbi:MAG: DUF1365 domain-containing protein [Acidimicrobiales bacterium]